MNNLKKFIQSSNKNNSNVVLNSAYLKRGRCTIIYVEGNQDKIFYEKFLVDIFKKNMPKFAILNGKTNVLKISQRNDDKRTIFIVDKDYNHNNEDYSNPNLIFTTGYSMENFFYFNDKNSNNINKFVDKFIEINTGREASYIVKQKVLEGLVERLDTYKKKTIKYYAFIKTLLGVDHSLKFFDSPYYVEELCEEFHVDFERYGFKKEIIEVRYKENIEYIKENGFMWIRGHDLFEVTKDYFNKIKMDLGIIENIDDNKILECANGLFIPSDFRNNLKYKVGVE